MLMLITPQSEFARSSVSAISPDSEFVSMFRSRSRGFRMPYVAPALACTSCMSTLTEDALCADCGKEFEP